LANGVARARGGARPRRRTLAHIAPPLLIADVPWLLYRAYFSVPESVVDARGRPVNALLGTVNGLLTATQATEPRAVAACLGAEQAAYRVRLYPPYHSHRDPMPKALAAQWRRAPKLLHALGWTVTETDELEADDVMFSYASLERERGGNALLLTADRDLYAAVNDSVAVLELRPRAKVSRVGPAQVRERYGVGPEQVADFIALRGDPSDGLPGAPGIGAKTAAQLLSRFGSLESLLAAAAQPRTVIAGELSPRLASVLQENAAQLAVFKQVATLQRIDVPTAPDGSTDYAAGARAAGRLGMNGLAERLKGMATGRT
jgi:DNA polymerase-1